MMTSSRARGYESIDCAFRDERLMIKAASKAPTCGGEQRLVQKPQGFQ